MRGLSSLALELEGKRVEFAKEVFPKLSRVGIFRHPENPYSALAFREVEAAARALGVQLYAVRLSGVSDLKTVFATLKRDRVDVLVISGYDATLQNRRAIIAFASTNRLAAIYPLREYIDEGGLLS